MTGPPKQLTPRLLFEAVNSVHQAEQNENRTPDEQRLTDVLLVGSAARAHQFQPASSDIDLVAVVSGVSPDAVSQSLVPTVVEQRFRSVVRASGLSVSPVEGVVDISVHHQSRIHDVIEDETAYSLRDARVCRLTTETK